MAPVDWVSAENQREPYAPKHVGLAEELLVLLQQVQQVSGGKIAVQRRAAGFERGDRCVQLAQAGGDDLFGGVRQQLGQVPARAAVGRSRRRN